MRWRGEVIRGGRGERMKRGERGEGGEEGEREGGLRSGME